MTEPTAGVQPARRELAFMPLFGRWPTQPGSQQQGVRKLAENVWLVNFQENPEPLARLVDAAAQHKLHYGIFQLEAAPQWVPASFDPKTILLPP